MINFKGSLLLCVLLGVTVYLAMVSPLPTKHWVSGAYKCVTDMSSGKTFCSTKG